MRLKDIDVGTDQGESSFHVSDISHDPAIAQKVTSRLASLFIEENTRDRESQAEDTNQFLDSPLGEQRQQLRPPVAADRLRVTGEGQVVLELRHRWADGTTHLVFDPVEFLGRLAVLVPRPRVNLILYHGVLGPRAAWRSAVVQRKPPEDQGGAEATETGCAPTAQSDASDPVQRNARGYLWADLMRRTFGFDALACPRCGGRLRLLALIEQAAVVARILRHLGLPTEIPTPCAARAPPLPMDCGTYPMDDARIAFEPCS